MLDWLQGSGMNLRGPIIGIYNFPTIVIFCEGTGIAAAKALIEATAGSGGLSFPLRKDVRMYYRVRSSSMATELCARVQSRAIIR